MEQFKYLSTVIALLAIISSTECANFSGKDITSTLFGSHNEEIFPVAYADFNADKLTDVFAVSRNHTELLIYFAREEFPILRLGIRCIIDTVSINDPNADYKDPVHIVGVAPGDYNGDGLLDVMVAFELQDASEADKPKVQVTIFHGNLTTLNCLYTKGSFRAEMVQEPLMLDVNGDNVMDLFGEVYGKCSSSTNKTDCKKKKLWIFTPLDQNPKPIDFIVTNYDEESDLAIPNVNSFVDTNGDLVPELVLITNVTEEVVANKSTGDVLYEINRFSVQISKPRDLNPTFKHLGKTLVDTTGKTRVIGQSLFVDFNQDGKLMHVIPFSHKEKGKNSGLKVIPTTNDENYETEVIDLPIEFSDAAGAVWHFWVKEKWEAIESNYTSTIVLRSGDFNLDGYPDLIGVLVKRDDGGLTKAVLFENIPCEPKIGLVCPYPRTFRLDFAALSHYDNVTLATFFDIHENGLVDVVLVRRTNVETKATKDKYGTFAIQNSPDYDANFLKVMVLSPRPCALCPKDVPYGNLLSGPIISYHTTTQAGLEQTAVAAQMYRSSYFPLDLPYTIFGIGQSPNFIETLRVSVSNHSQEWLQIIPNSQIFVVPTPIEKPWLWTAKLFLTPSKAVLDTFGVLLGFCGIIALLVGGFQYKERREDRKERLEEANRFHMM